VRLSEWVAVAYFAYLFVVAFLVLPAPRRKRPALYCLAAICLVVGPLVLPLGSWDATIRDWLPTVHLLVGYWLSGMYFVAPMPAVERRFLAIDTWLYRHGLATIVSRAPRLVLEALEFAYLTCFVFVPGGMIILAVAGMTAHADRFWTLVLAGEFGSFGMLPWIQTRPPRDLEPPTPIDRRPLVVRDMNRFMVRRTSIGWNTFPSGHVAGALAAALAVSEAIPALTMPLFGTALAISISTVTGRYHYAVDGVAGAALTLGIWAALSVF
jgi:membrane-associated phospholipid phosphatase